MYNYLLQTFGKNRPILVSRIKIDGMSTNAIRQQLFRLSRDGLIKNYASGIYYIPSYNNLLNKETTLSRKDVLTEKYMKDDSGQICGYVTGLSLLNQFGLTSQVPAIYEICSNAATRSSRNIKIAGVEARILKPLITVSEENSSILQLLDALIQIDFVEVSEGEMRRIIVQYMENNKISPKDFTPYLKYYPDKIYQALYNLSIY